MEVQRQQFNGDAIRQELVKQYRKLLFWVFLLK